MITRSHIYRVLPGLLAPRYSAPRPPPAAAEKKPTITRSHIRRVLPGLKTSNNATGTLATKTKDGRRLLKHSALPRINRSKE